MRLRELLGRCRYCREPATKTIVWRHRMLTRRYLVCAAHELTPILGR